MRDQAALLEVVQQPDDVARVEAQGFGERPLAHGAVLLEQSEGNEVTGTKAARGHGPLCGAPTDAGEVVEQGQQPLLLDCSGRCHYDDCTLLTDS